MKAHCLFEQSGTFKNEFIKLGIPAEDYDIQNEFGETDNVIDLFKEIENAYSGGGSIFDKFSKEDIVLAFFPCIRFEGQIILHYKGTASQLKHYTEKQKLELDLKLHNELAKFYELITELAIVSLDKKFKLIIENPYSTQHYLTRYWASEPKWIDHNRRDRGDYQIKPTQFWFFNCEPKHNLIMDEPLVISEYRTHNGAKARDGKSKTTMRSMISPDYARRFIREFIL